MTEYQFKGKDQFVFWNAFLLLRQSKDTSLIHNFMELLLVAYHAKERGLTISASELQRAADCFRFAQGLHEAADAFAFLKNSGLEVKDLEFLLEYQLLYNKLKQALSCVEAVQEVFARNLHLFEIVELAGLSFESKDEAEDFLKEILKGKDIHPDQPSAQPDRPDAEKSWIFMGFVTRDDLSEEAAARVFAEDAAAFVGPVETDGRYWIYHILRTKQADLNEDVYSICEELIIQDFLKEKKKEQFGFRLDQFLRRGT
jgi:hypothetical protein